MGVVFSRNSFEVQHIYAGAVAAHVVYNKPGWNRSNKLFVDKAVRHHRPGPAPKSSIPLVIFGTGPHQAKCTFFSLRGYFLGKSRKPIFPHVNIVTQFS